MSDSVRPHRWQPTRLPCSWDFPGKNTGVGCHFLLQCMKVKREREVAQLCPTSQPHGLQPPRLLHPWDFPGKSTGVGCRRLLRSSRQTLPNQRSNTCLLHWQGDSLPLCLGSPKRKVFKVNLLKDSYQTNSK